jgi:hypothetical protein
MADYAERKRAAMAEKSRQAFAAKAEIGPLPDVVDRERKETCRTDLLAFLTTYFPQSTGLKPFSEDHKRMIARLQRCILFGGRMIEAVYRGFAKTTIGENAVLWAALYGHAHLLPLVGADKDAADENLDSIKSELESNDLLLEDFPEVCWPIRCLEGKTQRANSQTLDGKRTKLEFSEKQVVFPTVDGADSSGVCIRPTSLMSFNRGMKHKMPDGQQVRPRFVFIDDPQTDDSAASPAQVAKRLSKLRRTILKSVGHTGEMAVYIAATVIEPDDLVDQLLDRNRNPQWDGERVPMVRSWSDKHEDMWLGEYSRILNAWDRSDPDDKKRARRDATHYYDEHRAEMDAGCEVSWEHCYDDENELSAIQHAYNMLIEDGPDVFAAECQNQPAGRINTSIEVVTTSDVLKRSVGPERSVVPAWASTLTAFVDVQGNMLWYTVMAFADDFTAAVVDYGAWPNQKRGYYTKSDIRRTLAKAYPGIGHEAQIRRGLDELSADLLDRSWQHERGTPMPIDLMLVDEGYLTPVIYEFCRRSPFRSRVMPAKGMAIGASSKPFEEYQRREGETLGLHWRRTQSTNSSMRHIVHDPNFWKSFVWSRFRVEPGAAGAAILFDGDDQTHRMFADHVAASEYPVPVEGRGRKVDEWKQIPGRDNDLLDCVSGCCIAASVQGVVLGGGVVKKPKRKGRKRRVTGSWAS